MIKVSVTRDAGCVRAPEVGASTAGQGGHNLGHGNALRAASQDELSAIAS